MCKICLGERAFEAGTISGSIRQYEEGFFMEFQYDAYSGDSSFDGDEARMLIEFCPFCGSRLKA
jgi:hypothetical protein